MAYNLKSEEEVKEYIKNLGTEYRFGCYSEKKPEVCHLLGDFLEAIKKDYKKAGKVYKANCDDRDHPRSCHKYAGYVAMGKGEKKNTKTALSYLEKACRLGHADACFNHGMLLIAAPIEEGVERNVKMGLSSLEKACSGKSATGCFYLSGCYLGGIKKNNDSKREDFDIPKNMEKAFKYALEACHLGNMYGCANVSQMYSKGDGVKKDIDMAEKYKKLTLEMEEELTTNKTLTFQEGLS